MIVIALPNCQNNRHVLFSKYSLSSEIEISTNVHLFRGEFLNFLRSCGKSACFLIQAASPVFGVLNPLAFSKCARREKGKVRKNPIQKVASLPKLFGPSSGGPRGGKRPSLPLFADEPATLPQLSSSRSLPADSLTPKQ